MRAGSREIFTAFGLVGLFDGQKRFIPKSSQYVRACMSRIATGKKVTMTISETGAIRSDSQLRYHWVLMGFLADHTGFSKDEMHDAVMRLKFGEKEINLGGRKVMVRKSMSKEARLAKFEAVDLITYDLELCAEMDIRVPTAQELGYLPDKVYAVKGGASNPAHGNAKGTHTRRPASTTPASRPAREA